MPRLKEVLVEDWASYQTEVDRILEDFEAKRSITKDRVPTLLFRGQSNQSWPLRTTLDRFSTKSMHQTDHQTNAVDGQPREPVRLRPALTRCPVE
jgi:hypothetical protein